MPHYDPIDPLRYDATRTPNTIQAIMLVEVREEEEGLMTRLSDCPSGLDNECQESYSAYYNLETGFLPILTPSNAPHTFQQTITPAPACGVEEEVCCKLEATNPLVVANPGIDPNQYLYTIAVKPSKAKLEQGCITGGCSDLDFNGLAAALALAVTSIKTVYPAFILNNTTLQIHRPACCGPALSCIKDLDDLIQAVNDILATPAIIDGNPACGGFDTTPNGTVVRIIGQDVDGKCVQGPVASDPCTAIQAMPLGTAVTVVGLDSTNACIRDTLIHKHSADYNFIALTPLVVPHNLNLTDPLAYVLTAREALGVGGGDDFAVQVTAVTANSITLLSNTSQNNVRITIIG